jgi:heme/copper-type cytochrome/quinol oxidase subunit 3
MTVSTPNTEALNHSVTTGHAHEVPVVSEHDREFGNENMKLAMWLFIGSEIMFFTVLIAVFITTRIRFPEEHAVLNIPLTSLNTFLLLTSSFTVVRAIAAVQANQMLKFQRSLALTGLIGTIFLAVQAFEYSNLSHEGLTINSGQFGMAFFTLTGFHGFHVLCAVIWCAMVFWKAFNGKFTQQDHFRVEFFGLYWHFVDIVWILIFVLVYLI